MRPNFRKISFALLSALPLAAISSAGLLPGCTTEPYCFSCGEDLDGDAGGSAGSAGQAGSGGSVGGFSGTGGSGIDPVGGSAGSGEVLCDNTDFQTDPINCGACGHKCNIPGAFPACVAGLCVVDSCAPNRWDLDKDPKNGCEYACTPSQPPDEVCDGKDNDCDGKVDEGSELQTDPDNCGACGVACSQELPNTVASGCVEGLCAITTCAEGYGDVNKVPSDGCEYTCPVSPPVEELCNGIDDDCDGNVDNGNPGGGQPCEETCPNGVCLGECTAGTRQCAGDGTYLCIAGKGPTIEICDGKDNDCNGFIDEGFDLQTDLKNCGACGAPCAFANAVGSCQTGSCSMGECLPGFADLDGDPSNGCEHTCDLLVPGVEICDGKDNDCNGLTDEEDPGLLVPQGLCNNTAGTPCEGAVPVCKGADGFKCNYGPGVEVDANGGVRFTEQLCDGIDGNCDGKIDETFSNVGKACNDGKVGACQGTGVFVCNATADGAECKITNAGQAGPQPEQCNGIDDDCNGQVDDALPVNAFSTVFVAGNSGVLVDTFEASRPDASNASQGVSTGVACSTAKVLPWSGVTYNEARNACSARGAKWRLCSATELANACNGPTHTAFPYGATYSGSACNGADKGSPSDMLPTGSLATCKAVNGAFDLSGNATEWTSTQTGETKTIPNYKIFQLHGGSYLSPSIGLACTIGLAPRAAENAVLENVGFRCCKDPLARFLMDSALRCACCSTSPSAIGWGACLLSIENGYSKWLCFLLMLHCANVLCAVRFEMLIVCNEGWKVDNSNCVSVLCE